MGTLTTRSHSTLGSGPPPGRDAAAAADAAPGGRLLDRKAVEAEYGPNRSTVDGISVLLAQPPPHRSAV